MRVFAKNKKCKTKSIHTFPLLSGKGKAFHCFLFRNTSQSLSNYCTDALITVFTKLYDVSYAKLTPRFKYLQVSLRISILYFCVSLNMTSLGVWHWARSNLFSYLRSIIYRIHSFKIPITYLFIQWRRKPVEDKISFKVYGFWLASDKLWWIYS